MRKAIHDDCQAGEVVSDGLSQRGAARCKCPVRQTDEMHPLAPKGNNKVSAGVIRR